MSATEKLKKKKKKDGAADEAGPGVGRRLRMLREEKGLSIDTVVEATRISRSNLRAIEEHRLDELPAASFTRGLVILYAEYLGLDGQLTAEEYLREGQSRWGDEKPAGRIYQLDPKKLAEPVHVPPVTWAVGLLITIAALLLWLSTHYNWKPLKYLGTLVEKPGVTVQTPPPLVGTDAEEKIVFPEETDKKEADRIGRRHDAIQERVLPAASAKEKAVPPVRTRVPEAEKKADAATTSTHQEPKVVPPVTPKQDRKSSAVAATGSPQAARTAAPAVRPASAAATADGATDDKKKKVVHGRRKKSQQDAATPVPSAPRTAGGQEPEE